MTPVLKSPFGGKQQQSTTYFSSNLRLYNEHVGLIVTKRWAVGVMAAKGSYPKKKSAPIWTLSKSPRTSPPPVFLDTYEELFVRTKKCRKGKFLMSKFKHKSASKVLDWSQRPLPPLKICPNKKKGSKYLSFCQKKCLKSFGLGSTPPPSLKKNVRIQADKSASNNLDSGWTPPFGDVQKRKVTGHMSCVM